LARDIDTFKSNVTTSKDVSFRSNKLLTGYDTWKITMPSVNKTSGNNNQTTIDTQTSTDVSIAENKAVSNKTVLDVQKVIKDKIENDTTLPSTIKGITVEPTGVMDNATTSALKIIQEHYQIHLMENSGDD
jgi:hypothetical protein